MTFEHYYITIGLGYACYALGVLHGAGYKDWSYMFPALIVGTAWPIFTFRFLLKLVSARKQI